MGYALHRTSIALLVFGFSMMPGLIVFHFWGPTAGSFITAVGPAILAAQVSRHIRSGELLKSFLTSRCDVGWQFHPAVGFSCGAVFMAAGLWIIAMVTDGSGVDEKRMTAAERLWFGAIFVLLGSGILVSAVSFCLLRKTPHGGR